MTSAVVYVLHNTFMVITGTHLVLTIWVVLSLCLLALLWRSWGRASKSHRPDHPPRLEAQFGMSDEWTSFAASHQPFLERFPNLRSALKIAFIRQQRTSEPVDRVVFFGGRLCVEDFMEILLLCGNGYGIGALKILRGMYELCVTTRYLHQNPAETEAFFDFHWISQYKLTQALKDTFGDDVLPSDKIKELRANRDKVRERFMVTLCDKCGSKGLNYTWNKLDFVSMARQTGDLGKLIVPGYYLPTRQVHSTVEAIVSRLKQTESGGLDFDEGSQRGEANDALLTAHNLLLNMLDLQKEHFKLDSLAEPLQTCFTDFMEIWK
jgi:uncharacterized protein DUF5677